MILKNYGLCDRDRAKEGRKEITARDSRYSQITWKVYSRRKKEGTHGQKDEGPAGKRVTVSQVQKVRIEAGLRRGYVERRGGESSLGLCCATTVLI